MSNDIGFGLGESYQVFNSLPQSTREALINPSAQTIGKALNALVLCFTAPLIKLGITKEAKLERFKNEIQQETNQIPEENRDSSKLGLVIKAIEEAKYQLNEDDIRAMYAKLIAATVDNRKNHFVTPRIAVAISQLGPDDALLLKYINEQNGHVVPLGYVIKKTENGSSVITKKSVDFLGIGTFIETDTSLDILESLGIIKVWTDAWLTSDIFDGSYNRIETSARSQIPEGIAAEETEFSKGYFKVTDFGEALLQCIF